jgi:hypothetical protein
MERSVLSHLKRAPSKNIHRGRLHALLQSRSTAVHHQTWGGSRWNSLFRRDAEVAKPLWIGCKSSDSDEIPAQSEPDSLTPPWSYPLDVNVVEAVGQLPEVTATAAPELEIWPAEGYKATKFDPNVGYKFFPRDRELEYLKKLISGYPEAVIVLLGNSNSGKTVITL